MILSRVWYVVLGLAVAVSLYVVYFAVGQYDRQNARALKESLASDSQTVEWALKIDARRHIDALLPASVDATLQQTLVAADGKDGKIPDKLKADAKKALGVIPSPSRPTGAAMRCLRSIGTGAWSVRLGSKAGPRATTSSSVDTRRRTTRSTGGCAMTFGCWEAGCTSSLRGRSSTMPRSVLRERSSRFRK